MASLQAALGWAVETELLGRMPIARIKALPETEEHSRYRRRALTDDEIARFLDAVAQDDADCVLPWSYRRVPQLPLFRTLFETGCR